MTIKWNDLKITSASGQYTLTPDADGKKWELKDVAGKVLARRKNIRVLIVAGDEMNLADAAAKPAAKAKASKDKLS